MSDSNIKDLFWIHDPSILSNYSYKDLIPSTKSSFIEILNIVTIVLFYLTFIFVFRQKKVAIITLTIILIIVFVYFVYKKQAKVNLNDIKSKESHQSNQSKQSNKSTNENNPLKNTTMKEIINQDTDDSNSTLSIDDISDNDIEQYVTNNRNYYKVPGQNNKTDFARWLYQSGETCKENSMMCSQYEDIRYNKYVPDFEVTSNSSD